MHGPQYNARQSWHTNNRQLAFKYQIIDTQTFLYAKSLVKLAIWENSKDWIFPEFWVCHDLKR